MDSSLMRLGWRTVWFLGVSATLLVANVIAAAPEKEAPSLRLAQQLQDKKDYVSALLVWEELQKKDPENTSILKKMIECHERMDQADAPPAAQAAAVAPESDGVSDLPDLVPSESASAPQDASPRAQLPPTLFPKPSPPAVVAGMPL